MNVNMLPASFPSKRYTGVVVGISGYIGVKTDHKGRDVGRRLELSRPRETPRSRVFSAFDHRVAVWAFLFALFIEIERPKYIRCHGMCSHPATVRMIQSHTLILATVTSAVIATDPRLLERLDWIASKDRHR